MASLFLLIFSLLKSFPPLHAENFYSSSYQINMGNLNMTGGGKTSPSFRLTDTVGQNAPGEYDGSSTTVKSGFQYIYDLNKSIVFSIDNLAINFGTLTPQVGTTQVNTLTITTPYGKGYEIYAAENHPLKTIGLGQTSTIPDTTCDSGTCTQSSSGTWTSSSAYGFGFNASGVGASGIFTAANQYRQFADLSSSETPQVIATENTNVTARTTSVIYKLNISSQQAAGTYENAITYIAIPKY